MRPTKIRKSVSKNPSPNILQEESSKLKQKLQHLRQQVTKKKHEKQMNKTSQSSMRQANEKVNKLLTTNYSKGNTQYPAVDKKLIAAFSDMKIESFQESLKEKGINTYDRLLSLTQEQIDEWKDLVVGCRIKLKKYIKTHRHTSNAKNENISNQNSLFTKKETPPVIEKKKPKNIQDIIKQRGDAKIFVPINREFDEYAEYDGHNAQSMTDADQDVIIQSFMNIFQPRKGILKDKKAERKPSKHQRVNWSKEVEEMVKRLQTKKTIKYPKQAKPATLSTQSTGISSQQVIQLGDNVVYKKQESIQKYCWKCFRKIDMQQNIHFLQVEGRFFCCLRCQEDYEEQKCQFQEIGLEYRQGSSQQSKQSESSDEEPDDGLECIDLSII